MRRCSLNAIVLIFGATWIGSVARAVDLQPKMGEPLAGLSAAELARFNAGKVQYTRTFSAAEGLGPIMNQTSCAACHNNPVGGTGTITVTRFGFFDEKNGGFDPLDSLGGSLRQAQSINGGCAEQIPPEANVIAQRVTTSSLGLGLLEAIPDASIIANQNPGGPGVSGRVHMVQPLESPLGPQRVGRFGWKAQVATVLSFSGDAALNEMGITNDLVPTENDPNGVNPPTIAQCDTVADPEDVPDGQGVRFIDKLTDFQRFLAAPPQTPRFGMTGETVFNAIGCNACHVAAFTTDNNPTLESSIRNKAIRPYSDFLLHDMGILGDGIAQGQADVREFRTPPLWGMRVRQVLLHDSRVTGGTFASRVTAAIAQHNVIGSEAAPSGAAFAALSSTQKNQLIAFLDSLGRAEFDANGDNIIDLADLLDFKACFLSGPVTPDSPCAVHDIDQDGDVDNDDLALFLTAYTGPQGDCNANAVNDVRDILTNVSLDCDFNGVPDECQPEAKNIAVFIAVALGQNTDRMAHCFMDKNRDGEVDGRDVQPFVRLLVGP